MRVQILDGVFDGDDVSVQLFIDEVQHRRKSSRLSAACGADDEHQAAPAIQQILDVLRQPDLLECHELGGQQPHCDAVTALLPVDADSEPCQIAECIAEIRAADFIHLFPVILRRDLAHELLGVLGFEGRQIERSQTAGQAQYRRTAHHKVQVGRISTDNRVQKLFEARQTSPPDV